LDGRCSGEASDVNGRIALAIACCAGIVAADALAAPGVSETGHITQDESRTTTGCVSQRALAAASKAVAAGDREGFKELFNRNLCVIMPRGARVRVLEVDGWLAPDYKIRLFWKNENVVLWTVGEALDE